MLSARQSWRPGTGKTCRNFEFNWLQFLVDKLVYDLFHLTKGSHLGDAAICLSEVEQLLTDSPVSGWPADLY